MKTQKIQNYITFYNALFFAFLTLFAAIIGYIFVNYASLFGVRFYIVISAALLTFIISLFAPFLFWRFNNLLLKDL